MKNYTVKFQGKKYFVSGVKGPEQAVGEVAHESMEIRKSKDD